MKFDDLRLSQCVKYNGQKANIVKLVDSDTPAVMIAYPTEFDSENSIPIKIETALVFPDTLEPWICNNQFKSGNEGPCDFEVKSKSYFYDSCKVCDYIRKMLVYLDSREIEAKGLGNYTPEVKAELDTQRQQLLSRLD